MPVRELIKQRGFTLVEVLVISPFIILLIGGFIALIVGLTGESLQLRVKNASAYDVQAALDEMEANASKATAFLTSTTGITISPQGKNNSSAPFTNTSGTDPNTLITMSPATTKSPFDSTRSLIYQGTGACNSANPTYNYVTVFFVDTSTSTLYKRTILPQSPACAQPWQRASCSEANVSSTPAVCKVADEKLLDGVENIKIDYYASAATADNNPTTADAAKSVKVSISLSKQAAGNAVSYSGSMRTTSINASQQPPTQTVSAPEITWSRNISSPYVTNFNWEKTGSATGYNIRYRMGSSTWVNGPQNQNPNTTTYSVTANARKQNADIEVTALLSGGGTYTYPVKTTAIPNWTDCTPQNNWRNYDSPGSGYAELGFTKTVGSQMVGLKGLLSMSNGGAAGYTGQSNPQNYNAVCTLPVGFRPMSRQIFQVNTDTPSAPYGRGWGRVDVDVDGTVTVIAAGTTNSWVSLDGIIFATSSTPMSVNWTNGTLVNGWNYNSYGGEDYGVPRYGVDSQGRAIFEGLASSGPVNSGLFSTLPASVRPSLPMHIPSDSGSSQPVGDINIGSAGDTNSRQANGYRSTQYLYYPSSFTNWRNLAFQNSWRDYGGGWSTGQCYKGADDIVIVKGLLAAGNTTYPAALTNLTAASGGSCGAPNASGATFLMPIVINPDYSGSLDLGPDGTLTVTRVDSGWTSLDGFHFIAD